MVSEFKSVNETDVPLTEKFCPGGIVSGISSLVRLYVDKFTSLFTG